MSQNSPNKAIGTFASRHEISQQFNEAGRGGPNRSPSAFVE